MLNSYAFVSSRIKIRSLDSTINKEKNLCIPYTARKNDIFIKKSQKFSFFDLKCAILNRYDMNPEIRNDKFRSNQKQK